jgi:hypothetical protein
VNDDEEAGISTEVKLTNQRDGRLLRSAEPGSESGRTASGQEEFDIRELIIRCLKACPDHR